MKGARSGVCRRPPQRWASQERIPQTRHRAEVAALPKRGVLGLWSGLYATACRRWSLLLVAVIDEARLSHSGVVLTVTVREL
ncbi:hypothetical protein GA0070216_107149 [Micromonospora matsumotoense]|uniref:Uncharacterized protein n=1 Tax=Micromonospora matsumotoense TaxID=121616 RepID=A0A1C4YTQ6_9ACTN|nr:hypothetical protein GA0070216_107149 [Micromonospora matsumotoense]